MAVCNFSKHICYLQFFKISNLVHSTKPSTFSKISKALTGMCMWLLLHKIRWKPVVLTQELVIFPLIRAGKIKFSFPKTFGTTKVHVLRLSVSYKATWKNVVLCSFFHVPEQEIDGNCIVKPITTLLYSFLPKRLTLFGFPKAWFITSSNPDWN